ncbi:MAG TPA: ABC transporter permease [Streptosporangiaceae bacterium]|nr:ABC transporter permease [Streptosporangiaceae bacterium]
MSTTVAGTVSAPRHVPPGLAAVAHSARDTLRAEWTKQRTVATTAWLLASTAVLTIAVSALVTAVTRCQAGGFCTADTTKVSLTGVRLAQAGVAVLAVLAISDEYATGMIRTTFVAMPRRSGVLAAKAAVLTGLVLASAVVAVAGCLLAGRLVLPGNGFTPARGFPVLSLAHGDTLRAAAGSVLYLALAGLLSLGIATAIRDSAASIGTVLGLLYLAPFLAALLGAYPAWQHRVERYAPMSAGLTIQDTTGLRDLPISPWGGLGVLAVWATAALLAAGLSLRLRDA